MLAAGSLDTGFSQNVGRPASMQAMMSSGWTSVAAAITTPSTPACRSASGLVAGSAPTRSTTDSTAAGTAS